jgi:hypothetical protein
MQYLLLIYSDESQAQDPPQDPKEFAEWLSPWTNYSAALEASGCLLGGDALLPTQTARTVTATGGSSLITDGPFAETKEQLGGYYLLECASMEEAVAWAAKCPVVAYGRVEVRPVMQFGS